MPRIELSTTYRYWIFIDNDIDSRNPIEELNKKSIVARYFKLQTRSDVSRKELDVIFSLFFTTRSREMYASDFASRFFDKSCNQSQAEWMILCTYLMAWYAVYKCQF